MTQATDKCRNCGGDSGIHQYQTAQCPVGGVESPMGREQKWKTSTFAPVTHPADQTNGEDSAYPTEEGMEGCSFIVGGLTKREEFAKAAMQGLTANPNIQPNILYGETAVKIADALIEALNKR